MKKRLLSALLALCMVVTLLPGMVWAVSNSDITYSVTGGSIYFDVATGTIMDCDASVTEAIIPDKINGIAVTSIGVFAFLGCCSLTSVTIPNSVTYIESEAFSTCTSLTSVTIPNSVTYIGMNAFSSCTSLTNIIIPDSLTEINSYEFWGCGSLTSVTIPDSVTDISFCAFKDCNSLTDVYYSGSESQWKQISVGRDNEPLTNATIHYNSTGPDGTDTSESALIPDDAVIFNGHYYKIYSDRVSWSEAKQKCESLGGYLVTITSQEEQSFIETLNSSNKRLWIGAYRDNNFNWQWVTNENWSYTNWGEGEPNNSSNVVSNENCVAIWPNTWNDLNNDNKSEQSGYICEWGDIYTSTGPATDSGQSPGQDSRILALSPANGATDVTYDAANPLELRITFDREIDNTNYRPNVDLNVEGGFSIYRMADDKLIYRTSSSFSSSYSGDFSITYLGENTLVVNPLNASTLFEPLTEYYVVMGEGLVKFKDGTASPAVTKGQWTFTTAEPVYFDKIVNIGFHTSIKNDNDEIIVSKVSVLWNDGWFKEPATTYNHDLAKVAMALSGAAYVQKSSATVTAALEDLGFKGIYANYTEPNSKEDCDTISYTFAKKEVYADGSYCTLVAVVVKGTSPDYEWYSNFDIGTEDIHKGFGIAAGSLMKDLNEYITDQRIEGRIKFLVTGHSRGAAVANLIAAELTSGKGLDGLSNLGLKGNEFRSPKEYGYGNDDVYGYTFATPKASKKGTESGYKNIYNVLNPEDLVTRVALSWWGFNHYGVDLILPSKSFNGWDYVKDGDQYIVYPFSTLSRRMESIFAVLTGKDFDSYGGTRPVDKMVSNIYSLANSANAFIDKNKLYSLYGIGIGDLVTTQEYFSLLADKLTGDESATAKIVKALAGDFTLLSGFFVFQENGIWRERFSHAHSPAAYYSWLDIDVPVDVLFSAPIGSATEVTFKRVVIACPVDVYVRDQNGTIVASVVNEEIVENTLAVYVEDGEKTIDLPNGQEYLIEIVAWEEGTVSYTVEENSLTGVGSTTLRTVSFDNIEIEAEDVLTGTINDSFSNPSADYALTKNGEEIIYPDSDTIHQIDESLENVEDVFAENVPQIGNNLFGLWPALAVVSVTGLVALVIIFVRKRKS